MKKVIFAVPGYLALAVFLTSSFETLPKAEEPLPRKKYKSKSVTKKLVRKVRVTKRRRVSSATFYEAKSPYPMTWPIEAINLERANCQNILRPLSVTYVLADPIGEPDHCGSPAPVEISMLAGVKIHPPATLNCQFVAKVHHWIKTKMQPAAKKALGNRVIEMTNVSSYTCRKRRGGSGKRMSEHAYANALDISAFLFKSSDKISVEEEWGAGIFDRRNANFLKTAHTGGCKTFSTFLGPDYNAAHANHFHMDFARDGRGGICR